MPGFPLRVRACVCVPWTAGSLCVHAHVPWIPGFGTPVSQTPGFPVYIQLYPPSTPALTGFNPSLPPQPILSPSILDHLINNDRKLPPEYNLPHTYVEMQVGVGLNSVGGGLAPLGVA